MAAMIDWLGPMLAAVFFIGLGLFKLNGLRCGYEGGRGKPLFQYVCGSCPAWRSRAARVAVPVVLFAVGLLNLTIAVLAWRR